MAKKELTKKQKLIILLIYTFRFINSKQIQEFLNHKDHRRINSWLKDLVEKDYIARDFKFVFGTLTKPAVFSLTIKGRKYIRESFKYHFPKYLKRISRDNKASKATKIRCQIIADWYLQLFSPLLEKGKNIQQKNTNDQKQKTGIDIIDNLTDNLTTDLDEKPMQLNSRRFFTSAYFPDFILLEKLKPDAYIKRKMKSGISHGFLFVIDAYVPRFLLRYTTKHIFDTLDEEYWEDETIHSLHMYFLCPNNQIIIYMQKLLTQPMESYYYQTPLNVHFATRNQFYKRKNGQTEKIGWRTVASDDEQ